MYLVKEKLEAKMDLKLTATNSIIFICAFWAIYQTALLFNVIPGNKAISAFYPAPALIMAFVYRCGWRAIPVVFVAAVLATYPRINPIEMDLWIWVNNTRQVAIYSGAAYVLRLCIPTGDYPFTRHNLYTFLKVSAGAGLIASVLAMTIYDTFNIVPKDILTEILVSFLLGDLSGLMVFAPWAFLMVFAMEHKGGVFKEIEHQSKKLVTESWDGLIIGGICSTVTVYAIGHEIMSMMLGFLILTVTIVRMGKMPKLTDFNRYYLAFTTIMVMAGFYTFAGYDILTPDNLQGGFVLAMLTYYISVEGIELEV